MTLNTKNINNFYPVKNLISRCDDHARNHATKAPRAVWAQYRHGMHCTFLLHSVCLLKCQSENKKLSWSE